MSDLVGRITGDMNFFQKILAKIPGFSGYVDRTNRRAADKILREAVANRTEELWQRVSSVQRDLVNQGKLKESGQLEPSALKLRQFIDRVRTAPYGYAGFFDAIKINQKELDLIYQFDLALLELVDEISRALDNLEGSMDTDGMPAAIRHLKSLAQKAVDTYNRRKEVLLGGFSGTPSTPVQ